MFIRLLYFFLFLAIFGFGITLSFAKDRHERAKEFRERTREKAGVRKERHEQKHETYRERKLGQLDERKAREKENIERKYEKRMEALDRRKEYLGEENYNRQREKIEADKRRDMERLETHFSKRREHIEEHGPAGRLKEKGDEAEESATEAAEELMGDPFGE